ncbi:DNA mismatch repair protein msh-2 [Wickerhamiella sorbophila]|uniref:DNA mismatch repair protein MSH2 n=1 Tax=Wickerhamiella sorbophila TaxID=45607 RepID=A0A2T0FDA0_9ASCO|nr:DNA mismatch repair protein msh-2 [Wickerhamiella sorbophila]PRT52988.1 DNA mismatch repair protein msh-2 [Wickerhamiella sorbophila]
MSKDDAGLLSFAAKLAPEPNTIRVFERADDYVTVGDEAAQVAQIVYKTSSALKRSTPDGPAICTMNGSLLANFLKEALQNLGLRVIFYSSASGSRTNWQISKEASPGNLQEVEDLIGTSYDQNPVIIAVKVQNGPNQTRVIGFSFIDTSSRELGLSQFVDNDLFSNFESLAIQLGVKEALIVDDASQDTQKVTALLSRLNILASTRKSSQFSSKDVAQDLERLTGKTGLELAKELSLEAAVGSAGALIKYLSLMAHTGDYGQYKLTTHDLSQYMRLDASAIKALNIMPGPRDGSKTMSLFGLLNRCKTTSGVRTLAQWLKQPLMDHQEITARHDLVQGFIENSITRQTLRDDLFLVVPDLGKISRKFYRNIAKLEDVVRVYQLAIRLNDFIDCLSDMSDVPGIEHYYVGPLKTANEQFAKFAELVETTVDLQALERNEYAVNPAFDDRLQTIKGRKEQLINEIKREQSDIGRQLGMEPDKKLKLEEHHVYGWCLRLTRTDASCLRKHSGFTELATLKAGTYFLNRKLRELNNEYSDLSTEYRKTQSTLVKEVVEIAGTYTPILGPLGICLAHLDVIVSFAEASQFAPLPYVRPTMHPRHEGNITLKQARHPCMEAQSDMRFIPNDVELKRGSSEFLIITGPNMGGKSTYIRQIGVICLMAQIGCFVPCSEAELCIVDCVLARVGAGDSQLKGISTFMAEMLETASILKTATKESLIVIDELGRGTSTYDGFGLAWAISQHIVEKIGCFTLFATHFHELTALSDNYPQVENMHVLAETTGNEEDITLLYQVAPGISDKSFGIHVAEVVSFPEKVIRMAKRKAEELEELEGAHNLTQDDIVDGTKRLKQALQTWAQKAPDDEGAAAKLLRDMIEDHRSEFEQQPFLKQVLECL